jgi:glycosyltransferase involved in cell wall biosynthesis
MIVKNEEEVLDRCLEPVSHIVDEIILVDTGSTDRTKKVGQKYNCEIFDFDWKDDFSLARNFSFSKATMDYILWLDADDVVENSEIEKLKKLKNNIDGTMDAYSMIYNYDLDENENVLWSFRRYRLVKRSNDFRWVGYVHEYLDISGNLEDTNIYINHKREKDNLDRNLKIYETLIKKGQLLSTRDFYYYAKELFDNEQYEKSERYFNYYLEKEDGWIENKIVACNKLSSYYYNEQNLYKSKLYSLYTFQYDAPRAKSCCQIGDCFQHEEKLEEAIFWYKLAYKLEKPNEWGFYDPADYTWRPHLQLCICYYKLGKVDKAFKHNKIAYNHNSTHESILYNNEFFENLGYESVLL